MYVDSNYENECKRCNVEKWKKALRIAEIRKELNCTYEQAEQIYNDEKAKKIFIMFRASSKSNAEVEYKLGKDINMAGTSYNAHIGSILKVDDIELIYE